MREDLSTRSAIEILIDRFYQKALKDELIKHFFTEVVQLNWEKHIPLIVDFWESNILGTGNYQGNPMLVHLELNRKSKLEAKHFDRWLELWELTIKENFEGEKAELAMSRAQQIAQLMQYKIKQEKD